MSTRQKTHNTSARHFAIFKAECLRLAKLWNLCDWEFRFTHEPIHDSLATCYPNSVSRICVLRLSMTWGPADAPTDDRILASARHEMSHAVTGELVHIARSRSVTDDEITAAIEVTARRLDRMLPR